MGRGIGGLYTTTFDIIKSLTSYLASVWLLLVFSNLRIYLLNFKNYFYSKFIISSYSIQIRKFEFSISNKNITGYLNTINGYVSIIFGSIFFSQLLSSYNTGGNVGNFQMGFLPLFILIFPYLIDIKNFSNKNNSYIDHTLKNTLYISIF